MIYTNKNKLIDFFFDFCTILEKNNLWYAAEFGTLLGTIREGKMIEWDDDIDLIISFETYQFLKDKYPNNILDTDQKGYPFLFAKWVFDVNNYLTSRIFIDLFIIVPSSAKKVKKYKKYRNIFRFSNQMFSKGTKYKPTDFVGKMLKVIFWPIQWTTKKMSILDAVNILKEDKEPEFNFIVNLPIFPTKEIDEMKRTLTIWERKKIKFEKGEIYIPIDYDEVLKASYGNDYMMPKKTKTTRIHIDTINTISYFKSQKKK